jgi:hypothetical protein
MKLSTIVCASVVTLGTVAFATDGAFAAVSKPVAGMTTHGGSKGYGVTDQTTCPAGQVLFANPITGKQSCVQPSTAVKHSGVPKNSTTTVPDPKGSATATPLNNRQN